MLPGAVIRWGLPRRGLPDLAYPVYWVMAEEDGEFVEGFSPLEDVIDRFSFLEDAIAGFSPLGATIEIFSGLSDVIEASSKLNDTIEAFSRSA